MNNKMDSQFLEIKIKQGILKGQLKQPQVVSGKPYYAFQGIPYAEPPVGKLRFKSPEPHRPWDGVRDALKDGNSCVQLPLSFRFTEGDEDCLFLNVYIPEVVIQSGSLNPVMVFIHGGGFIGGSGSSDAHGPDYFMREDVILVTINYRCGALGFLSLGTKDVPGNAGLKDQTLALQWVQDNITSFGGDKKNVTIFGVSSGGASVQYHMLSPLSKGLFHKVLIQSGFALNPWAFQPNATKISLSLAQFLGCNSQDPNEVLQFLQKIPAFEIAQAQLKIANEEDARRRYGLMFGPCIEIEGKNRFLTVSPRTLMEAGKFAKVPIMMGVSDKEGLVNVEFNKYGEEEFTKLNENPRLFIPLEVAIPKEIEQKTAKDILDFYMKGEKISWDTMSSYFDLVGDLSFNLGMEALRSQLTKQSHFPMYLYQFSYCGTCRPTRTVFPSLCPEYGNLFLTFGASHADEMSLLFKSSKREGFTQPSEQDWVVINKIVKVWVTFAKSGDPNCKELEVNWKPSTQDNHCFLDMGGTWTLIKKRMFDSRMNFWDIFYLNTSYVY